MKYFLKSGFTLIELIIVLLIMGLLISVGLPRFTDTGTNNTDKFIAHLNKLTLEGAHRAQRFNRVYKVFLNISGKNIELMPNIVQDNSSINSNIKIEDSDVIPDSIEILDFLIDNKSQFSTSMSQKRSAYFLIGPSGITQDTKIIFKDHNSKPTRMRVYEILLNPFMAQFKLS